jgi:hypothetical protein
MNEIERYLDEICRSLGGSHDLRQHIREELHDHLADAIEANVAKGLSEEDAARKAIEDFGDPTETRQGLQALYGHSTVAFLIDRAMDWKERTMKSGWKWSFAAMAILLIVMVGQLFLTAALFIFIFPRLQETYVTLLDERVPPLVVDTLRVAQIFRSEFVLLWGLPAAVAAIWALFEWRCKSENKPVIRLAGAAFATFLASAAFCFVAVVTVIALTLQTVSAFNADPRPYAVRALSDAERAMSDLHDAMASKDRDKMLLAGSSLEGALWMLSEHRQAVALASTINQGQVERLESTIKRLVEQSRMLHRVREAKELGKFEATWDIFQRQLKGESVEVPPPVEEPEEPSETEDNS